MFWSIPNTCLPASSSFQLHLDGEKICMGNNPCCPVPSRNIAASQSPTKSVFILFQSCPTNLPSGRVLHPVLHCLLFIFPAPCYTNRCPWFCALDGLGSCPLSFPLGKWDADMPPTALCLSPLSSAAEKGEPALTRREHFHISCRLWSQSLFQVTQSQQQPEQGEQGGKTKAW